MKRDNETTEQYIARLEEENNTLWLRKNEERAASETICRLHSELKEAQLMADKWCDLSTSLQRKIRYMEMERKERE